MSGEHTKVLTGDDIARLSAGNHTCKPETCGCHCGITYNKNWEWIIASHDGTHMRPKCKCIPEKCFICGATEELIDTITAVGTRFICAECEQNAETNYDSGEQEQKF